MKKGVLVSHGETDRKNIGDYVQTLAALQFAGQDAELLEREELHARTGEVVRVAMNAWFMHHPERFPPSSSVCPLFVSFHLAPRVRERFLSPATLDYLKAHEPIGCRDTDTVAVLEQHGIRAFYTSCLTLTLGETYHHRAHTDVPVFVDPWFRRIEPFNRVRFALRFVAMLPYMLRHVRTLRRLSSRCGKAFRSFAGASRRLVRLLYVAEFHRAYSGLFSEEVLMRADYVTHKLNLKNVPEEAERLKVADRLLKCYEHASFVVTSRLHCALPCTGMGTPVWVPFCAGMATGRYGGNEAFLNLLPIDRRGIVTSPTPVGTVDGKIHLDNRPTVRTEYRPFAERLRDAVRAFMQETPQS